MAIKNKNQFFTPIIFLPLRVKDFSEIGHFFGHFYFCALCSQFFTLQKNVQRLFTITNYFSTHFWGFLGLFFNCELFYDELRSYTSDIEM